MWRRSRVPCAAGAALAACLVAAVLATLTLVGRPATPGGARSTPVASTPASGVATAGTPAHSTPVPACAPRLQQCDPAGAPSVPAVSWSLGLSAVIGVAAAALVVPGFRWRRRRTAGRLPAGFAAGVLRPPRVLARPC